MYHKPPSARSTAALTAIELILGITPDDPLARMLIVLLHSNDRFDPTAKRLNALVATVEDIVRKLADREEDVAGLINKLARDLTDLSSDLPLARSASRRRRPTLQIAGIDGEIVVDTHRYASPMLAYLGKAFRGYTSVIDESRATMAARTELLFIVGLAIFLLLFCIAIGKQIF